MLLDPEAPRERELFLISLKLDNQYGTTSGNNTCHDSLQGFNKKKTQVLSLIGLILPIKPALPGGPTYSSLSTCDHQGLGNPIQKTGELEVDVSLLGKEKDL